MAGDILFKTMYLKQRLKAVNLLYTLFLNTLERESLERQYPEQFEQILS